MAVSSGARGARLESVVEPGRWDGSTVGWAAAHPTRLSGSMEGEKTSYIRDVWHDNLEESVANIREMIVNYPVISMVGHAHGTPCSRTHSVLPPTPRRTPLTRVRLPPSAGHRVPGRRRQADWLLQVVERLSLPDAPVQRGPAEDHPARAHLLQRRGRARPGRLHLPVQLQILARRGHLRAGLYRPAHALGDRLPTARGRARPSPSPSLPIPFPPFSSSLALALAAPAAATPRPYPCPCAWRSCAPSMGSTWSTLPSS